MKHWDPTQREPRRLDYIFFKKGDSAFTVRDMQIRSDWKCTTDTGELNLSDHYPVTATMVSE